MADGATGHRITSINDERRVVPSPANIYRNIVSDSLWTGRLPVGSLTSLKDIPKGEIQKILGQSIRKHRERVDLTQEELSEKSQVHRTYLADIERGTRNPSIETVRRLALALGVSISEIFQTAEM